MLSIKKCAVPSTTFLEAYRRSGAYTDCYTTEVPGDISFPEFIAAFYTTPLFRVERAILAWDVSKPSTDQQVTQLANGVSTAFAAWRVENRNERELMMCDLSGRTRSWFMQIPSNRNASACTRLYFGSAVVPIQNAKTGRSSIGFVFRVLLGFHMMYSILLLRSARSNIVRRKGVSR